MGGWVGGWVGGWMGLPVVKEPYTSHLACGHKAVTALSSSWRAAYCQGLRLAATSLRPIGWVGGWVGR